MKTGAAVLDVLRKHYSDQYHPCDIYIDRQGNWYMDGMELQPEKLIHKIDVAFNALHGKYGEDGQLQSFFELHDLPFTGSGSLGSAVGMNKVLAKKIFKDHGLKTPYGREISSEKIKAATNDVIRELFNSFMMPAVVKPASSGSSVGVSIVKYYDELEPALNEAAKHSDHVMIEEFIPGIEATCGVIQSFRGHDLYALPPVEIKPMTAFFDYEAKYAGKSQEIVPATFSQKIKNEIEELARKVHQIFGLRHYSRSDFIIHPRRGIYVLEVNTLPGLTGESLIPKSLRAIGSDTHELIGHLVNLAHYRL
jgi:D-alanine-D-alanine ligase